MEPCERCYRLLAQWDGIGASYNDGLEALQTHALLKTCKILTHLSSCMFKRADGSHLITNLITQQNEWRYLTHCQYVHTAERVEVTV